MENEPLHGLACVTTWLVVHINVAPSLSRTGHVPSAVGCVTAVCVARKKGAVLLATWWDWPATMATITSTCIWRGMHLDRPSSLDYT